MRNNQKHIQQETMDSNHPLMDRHQNFWQLASIQSAAFGIPVVLLGTQLTESYGAGKALTSICIGNLILWIIGLATVAMAYAERKNAIENLIGYVGKFGSILGGSTLTFAFLFWFSLHLTSTTSELNAILRPYLTLPEDFDIRIGAALGLSVALLSLGGIRLIKWIAVISFPFLFLFLFFAILKKDEAPVFKGTWGISLNAIASSMAITLAGIVNLPTFFRHSRSRAHAFFALTLMTLFTALIECSGIWLSGSAASSLFTYLNAGLLNLTLIILFLIISLLCVNLVNVYFASAAWEAMLPRLGGAKKYAIVGMGGTIAFTFFQAREPLLFLENVLDSFIASLGMTILMDYLVRRIVNHRERIFEKIISVLCWLCGCVTSVYVQMRTSLGSSYVFFSGIGATGLAFLIFIFIEETIWSFKHCIKNANHTST